MEEQSSAEQGVATALERVCTLESRLRQALQNSGPLGTFFGQDTSKDDKEVAALRTIQCVLGACLFSQD